MPHVTLMQIRQECWMNLTSAADVLQQIAAIRGAVNGLMREVIKGHLIDHIVREDSEAKREND